MNMKIGFVGFLCFPSPPPIDNWYFLFFRKSDLGSGKLLGRPKESSSLIQGDEFMLLSCCICYFSQHCYRKEVWCPSLSEKLPPEQNFDIGPDDVIVHEVTFLNTKTNHEKLILPFDFQDYGPVEEPYKNILNDIAIIFLPRPAILNAGVQLVCLPHIPTEYRCTTKGDKVSNILIFHCYSGKSWRCPTLSKTLLGNGPLWWVGDTPLALIHIRTPKSRSIFI